MCIVRLILICLLILPSLSDAFCFDEAGKAYGINTYLLQSIARVESNLNPNAINRNLNGSTDIGIMQINSSWIARLGLDSGRLVSDPCYNVMTGAKIFRYCIDKHEYTWEAVGCYNAVSKHKRVDYSWKVYNKIKAEGRRQASVETKDHTKPVATLNSSLFTPHSSLTFSVRDNAAIE